MSRETNIGSFLNGMILGVIAGSFAGILLAPKSGSETRNDLLKVIKDLSSEAEDYYAKAEFLMSQKLKDIKKLGAKINSEKYKELINEVISELKKDYKITSDVTNRLSQQLLKDWNTVSNSITKPVDLNTTKKTTKKTNK